MIAWVTGGALSPRGVRPRLSLLALACALPLLALASVLLMRNAAAERTAVETQVKEFARAVAENIDREIARIQTAAEVLATSPALKSGDFGKFYRQAAEVGKRVGTNVLVRDLSSRQLMNTRVPWGTALPRNPPFEVDRLALDTGHPQVSGLSTSAITRRPVAVVVVPVQRGAGRPPYLLSLTLDLDRLKALVSPDRLPPGWVAGFTDRDGTIVARSHRGEELIGTQIPPEIWERIVSAPAGLQLLPNLEGVTALQAYSRSELADWIVGVNVPYAALTLPARQGLATLVGGGAVLALCGLAVAIAQGRQIAGGLRSLAQSASTLAAGDATKPRSSGVREIDAVALGLWAASETIATRNAELAARTAELEGSEARLRAVLEQMPVGVAIAEIPSGRLFFHNSRAVEMLGHDILAPDDDAGYVRYGALHDDGTPYRPDEYPIARVVLSGKSIDREPMTYRRGDGQVIAFEVSAAPIRDASGRPLLAVSTFDDVSERRRAEAALRESEERFRMLAESTREGVAIHDGGRIVLANQAMADLFGLGSPAQVEGLSPLDLIAPEAREDTVARAASGFDRPYESVGLRRDGSTFPVEFFSRETLFHGRRAWVGLVRDLTAWKAAERALRESETRLRLERNFLEAVLQQVPVGISITEAAEAKALVLNDKAVEMLGHPRTDEGENRFTRYGAVHPDGRPYEVEDYPTIRVLRSGTGVDGAEMLYRHPDGRLLTFEVGSVPVRDSAGAVAAAVTALVDVTERRRTEERLWLLTAELSHRVKNTLAVVQGLAMQTILRSNSLEEFDRAFQGRLNALGKAHGMLLSTQWDGLDLADLARAELDALGAADEAICISGPSVTLGPKHGLSMALVLHELATNAAKHGALAAPGGSVELSWSVLATDPAELELSWVERRPGGVAQVGPRGFGTMLIRRSAEHDLGGQADLVMTGEGARWTLRFPVGRTGVFREVE